jgi:enoyl-CoA hydratase/carnithine racemase
MLSRFASFSARCAATASAPASASTVNVTMADHGVAIMSLNAPPVNTLNAQLLGDIKSSIDSIVSSKSSAIVLTSAKPGVFSSGLDIFSMYGKSDEELG